MGVGLWAGMAGLALSVGACTPPLEAPRTAGVCWRLAPAMNGTEDFRPMRDGVANLESCAVQLEGLHLQNHVPMTGAYQGRFIFVTDQEISSAVSAKAQRYWVFNPEQRAKIDAGYRAIDVPPEKGK
jgi:hypothetical protein